jgi:hypothetical protein
VPDCEPSPDYLRLAAEHRPTAEAWDAFVRATLLEPWLRAYRQATPWRSDVMEIVQGALTYLFDAAPTMDGLDVGDDRVVAVWGRSRIADGPRDRARQAGFIRNPASWSHRGARARALRRACRRRWHGHELLSAGGGPEPRDHAGRSGVAGHGAPRDRASGNAAVRTTGVHRRDVGAGVLDFGLLIEDRLRCERFGNRDDPDV